MTLFGTTEISMESQILDFFHNILYIHSFDQNTSNIVNKEILENL